MRRLTCLSTAFLACVLALVVGCGPAESLAVPAPGPADNPEGNPVGPPPPPKIIVDPNAPDPDPLTAMETTYLRHWLLANADDTGVQKAMKGETWVDGSGRRMNKHYVGKITEFKAVVGGVLKDIDELEVHVKDASGSRTILAKRIGNLANASIEWTFDKSKATGKDPGNGKERHLPAEFDGSIECLKAETMECLNVKLSGATTWTKATQAHVVMKK